MEGVEELPEEPIHPNDKVVFKQYPDVVQRETYPPLPSRGKPTNVPMPDDTASSWLAGAQAAQRKREQEGE